MNPNSPIFNFLENFIAENDIFAPIKFYDETEKVEYTILKDQYKITIVFSDNLREYINYDDNTMENIINMLSSDMVANDINIVKIKSGNKLIYKYNLLRPSTLYNIQNRPYNNEPRRGQENISPRRLRFGKKVKRERGLINLIKDLKKLN